jgi:urease accessory protein
MNRLAVLCFASQHTAMRAFQSDIVLEAPLQRARGILRVGLKASGGTTRLDTLFQEGTAKARLPNVAPGLPPEIVLLNTSGGLTGGDTYEAAITLGAGASATATTQACEKVYRSSSGEAVVTTRLSLAQRAALAYLPQETIVYERGRIVRRLEVDMAEGSTLIAVEAFVLGRTARGERVTHGLVREDWRIRRGGALAYADSLRLDGAVDATLSQNVTGAGAVALATLLLVAPDAEGRIERVRDLLADPTCKGAASAWNGLLAIRLLARDPAALRLRLVMLLPHVSGRAIPRVWSI